jgi:hypothetical protein
MNIKFKSADCIHIQNKEKYIRFIRRCYLSDQNNRNKPTLVIEPGTIGVVLSVGNGFSQLIVGINKNMTTTPLRQNTSYLGLHVVVLNLNYLGSIEIEA